MTRTGDIVHRLRHHVVIALTGLLFCAGAAQAQSRVGADSAKRVRRFGRDFLIGTAEGFGYAALDQYRNDPIEWGKGWPGYKKRLASNLGEFYIQAVVTQGLAAAMNRPLDYKRCTCRELDERFAHAVRGAVTDELPDGSHPIAIPRIVGAFAGAFAQASWRPAPKNTRTVAAIVNGTTSLGVGALINMYHEIRR